MARIFYTQGEVVITLNNLVLINGNAGDGDGGAIIWDSHSGHINNVNISNCVAQNGGAIFIGHVGYDEPCFIENITIKYSNATNGGGIYLLTPTAMHNITCINCTASQDGGAIYAYSDGQGRGTDIFTFYNNTAKNGGAAYIRGNNLTITDVDAQNNTATEYGGAIYADGNHLVLDGIKFINNNATRRGGAIFRYWKCLYLSNQLCKALAVLLKPYIPNKADAICDIINIPKENAWDDSKEFLEVGHEINKARLFMITLIGEKLAKVGESFIFYEPAEECSKCRFKPSCIDSLEEGHKYVITEVRDVEQKCPIHDEEKVKNFHP